MFEALQALPDFKAVRRQQVAQLLAWEEAVDGAEDANPLTRSRPWPLAAPPPFEPSRGFSSCGSGASKEQALYYNL